MANHACINGTLDSANYSSPMPLIGLYVAVATLICLVLMVYDVVAAILARKYWLPSKFFGLNSATMTLLSVAVKLPVDLTTSMPSPQDQLSKLAGTVLVCISMAFFMPSLGANHDSERFTNMVGLSIFVITVAVNICIQIHTGVIVLFIKEHIIILSLMLLLLVILWYISFYIKGEMSIINDQLNNLLAKGDPNMFNRLKLCHLYACCSDPQIRIIVHNMNVHVSTISVICSGILVQAAIRFLILKKLEFCQGISDYDWSMLYIVIIQVLTVNAGTIAIAIRCVAMISYIGLDRIELKSEVDDDNNDLLRKTWRKELFWYKLLKFFASLFKIIINIAHVLNAIPWAIFRTMVWLYNRPYRSGNLEDRSHEDFIAVPRHMARKNVDELIRFKNQVNSNESFNLRQFLSQNRGRVSGSMKYTEYLDDRNKKVCFLSIALLVKIAQASIPNNYLRELLGAFKEVTKIIRFIDEMMQPICTTSISKLSHAIDLLIDCDFTGQMLESDDIIGIQSLLNCITAKLKNLGKMLKSVGIYSEGSLMIDFISSECCYSSVEELVSCIEQMFVDMVLALLSQLPVAIYKMLGDSSMGEIKERVGFAIKLLYQTQSLEDHIVWIFPPGFKIFSFGELDHLDDRDCDEGTSGDAGV